ncbi:unnamed protein product [Lathyrus oleraceus]
MRCKGVLLSKLGNVRSIVHCYKYLGPYKITPISYLLARTAPSTYTIPSLYFNFRGKQKKLNPISSNTSKKDHYELVFHFFLLLVHGNY